MCVETKANTVSVLSRREGLASFSCPIESAHFNIAALKKTCDAQSISRMESHFKKHIFEKITKLVVCGASAPEKSSHSEDIKHGHKTILLGELGHKISI
jgi:hypothetical protein